MSSKKDTTYYMELQPGDAVQDGDQWLDSFGQWQSYVLLSGLNGVVGYSVRARRPIPATGQVTYEEVPGSRTTQQAIDQPQRERIAYEELQPGDIIQEGDEWQSADGRWYPLVLTPTSAQLRDGLRARRPYKISTILEIGDALANAQKAATQLQDERDKAQLAIAQVKAEFNNQAEVLAEVRADENRLCDDLNRLRGEYLKVLAERDEARAEVQRLQEVVRNLYSEPTARQVQQMLRTWATELDWSAGCFDSVARDEIDTIQKTLVAVIERIESIINPEGGSDGE